EIRPVGSSSTRTVDVRLITATNTELDELITSGKFRMDLYYRLNVISIRLPELKEKKEDIPLLVDHFLKHYSKVNNKQIRNISRTAMDHLLHYDWPGNVRELENVIERAVILTKEKIIDLCDILPLHNKPAVEVEESIDKRLEDLEVEYIRNVLKRMHGNQTKAAEILGIDRRTLYRKIKKHNIET
ncbi:MAG: helix-turn-helix domain-containing protein, partial [Thermodesulfobacteriota bacterium]|nr:helix-turn-helix domain-containing protein [Thermodesulfobacteriota bacterium]